jgi:ribose/xylose/arabinose/galactoside ABC-type transport system permease subunit
MNPRLKRLLTSQNFILFCTIIFIAFIVSLGTDKMLSSRNIINLFLTVSITGIMALGQAMVIISGNIDLSVGTMVSFIACITAVFIGKGYLNDVTAIIFGVGLGLACGTLNGLLVSRTKAESFIVTLATMSVFQGAALLAANGNVVSIGTKFNFFGGTKLFGLIPIPILILFILGIIVYAVMRYTKFGRRVYAAGGNSEAAFLAGVNVKNYKLAVYMINGAICSVSALLVLSRLSAANPNMAVGYELEAIAACVVGGISLSGGRGTIAGCFMGIILMGLITNSLNLLMVPIFYQKIAIGLVILAAVLVRTFEKSSNN